MGLCACMIRITSREGGTVFYVDASLICIKDLNISVFAFPEGGDPGATPPRPGRTVGDYMASGSTRASAFVVFFFLMRSSVI